MNPIFVLIAFSFFVFGTTLHAQNSILATGSDASASSGSVSYSIGQTVYINNTGTNGSVTQGVQQPYEISVITGLEEPEGIKLIISAYPNPATDFFILKVENYDDYKQLSYQLFDSYGKMLENKKVESTETSISTGNLITATYFLRVLLDREEIKIFKIVKSK